jgi:hypothetical protein
MGGIRHHALPRRTNQIPGPTTADRTTRPLTAAVLTAGQPRPMIADRLAVPRLRMEADLTSDPGLRLLTVEALTAGQPHPMIADRLAAPHRLTVVEAELPRMAGVVTTVGAERLLAVDIQPVDIHQPQAAARAVANAATRTTTTPTDATNSTFFVPARHAAFGRRFFSGSHPPLARDLPYLNSGPWPAAATSEAAEILPDVFPPAPPS